MKSLQQQWQITWRFGKTRPKLLGYTRAESSDTKAYHCKKRRTNGFWPRVAPSAFSKHQHIVWIQKLSKTNKRFGCIWLLRHLLGLLPSCDAQNCARYKNACTSMGCKGFYSSYALQMTADAPVHVQH